MTSLILALFTQISTPDTLAQKIMYRVYNRPQFNDMHAKITLTLIDSRGNIRKKLMETWSKLDPVTDETKMLIKFVEPADIRGTSFLIYEHKDRDDDMWFYLPAIRKVRRLAASGKSGAFMGSDFSNYDIGGGEYEDWEFKYLKEDKIDGIPCWVIESIPKDNAVIQKTGYSKQVNWVRKDNYLVQRADYYDRSGTLFKRIRLIEAKQINGIWFETKIEATDLDSEHKSVISFQNIETNLGLADNMFSIRKLQR